MIAFRIEKVVTDQIVGSIVSDNDGDPAVVEFTFIAREDEHGVHLVVSGFAGSDSHKLLEVSAPMEAYKG